MSRYLPPLPTQHVVQSADSMEHQIIIRLTPSCRRKLPAPRISLNAIDHSPKADGRYVTSSFLFELRRPENGLNPFDCERHLGTVFSIDSPEICGGFQGAVGAF